MTNHLPERALPQWWVKPLARQFLAGAATRVLASEPESRIVRSRILERELLVDLPTFKG